MYVTTKITIQIAPEQEDVLRHLSEKCRLVYNFAHGGVRERVPSHPSLTHENTQHGRGFLLCRRVHEPEDDSLSRLAVEDGGPARRGEDERDDRKILLAVDEDHPPGGSPTTSSIASSSSAVIVPGGFFTVSHLARSRGERLQGVRIV